jgi:hypothetical protein
MGYNCRGGKEGELRDPLGTALVTHNQVALTGAYAAGCSGVAHRWLEAVPAHAVRVGTATSTLAACTPCQRSLQPYARPRWQPQLQPLPRQPCRVLLGPSTVLWGPVNPTPLGGAGGGGGEVSDQGRVFVTVGQPGLAGPELVERTGSTLCRARFPSFWLRRGRTTGVPGTCQSSGRLCSKAAR